MRELENYLIYNEWADKYFITDFSVQGFHVLAAAAAVAASHWTWRQWIVVYTIWMLSYVDDDDDDNNYYRNPL